MYFFTHLFISKTLYRYLKREVELDKNAFAYGNIRPDISKDMHTSHTLENYLFIVNDRANQLINNKVTKHEFSIQLGEICHYVSDFFCYYHLNEDIYNKMAHHFFYELRLHLEILKMRTKHKIKLNPIEKKPRNNITSIVLDMRKDYMAEAKSYEKDMNYAFLATLWACKSILYYMNQNYMLTVNKTELKPHSLLPVKGGSL
jgi:hypothetical protein